MELFEEEVRRLDMDGDRTEADDLEEGLKLASGGLDRGVTIVANNIKVFL
jgi:hypothetical protein